MSDSPHSPTELNECTGAGPLFNNKVTIPGLTNTLTAVVTVPLTEHSLLTPHLSITVDQPSFGFHAHLAETRRHQSDENTRTHLFNTGANLNSK